MNNPEVLKELGRRLRETRTRYNYTQEKLARDSGVGTLTVANIEKGKSVSLTLFISVLRTLSMLENLETLIPETRINLVETKKPAAEKLHRLYRGEKSGTNKITTDVTAYDKTTKGKIRSMPRNPSILMFFRHAKIAENAGYGIHRIRQWRELTGEKVEIDSDSWSTTVTYDIPKPGRRGNLAKIPAKTIPERIRHKDITDEILELIKGNPKISRNRICKTLGLTDSRARYQIEKLKSDDTIRRIGGAKGGYWEITGDGQ